MSSTDCSRADTRLGAFARLAKGARKDNWRRIKPLPSDPPSLTPPPTDTALSAAGVLGESLFEHLPEMKMTTAPKKPRKGPVRSVTQVNVTESPAVVNTVEVERNSQAPIQLGAELEAAVAAKLMEGVLEFFKDRIRAKLADSGVTYGESEHGQVSISKGGGPSRVVNYDRFLEACRSKKIPVAVRNSLLSISKGALEDHFSGNEIDGMCDDGPPSTAACTIEQKKTLVTPIGVPDAIQILHAYFEKGIINDKTFLKKPSKRK